MTAKTVVEVDGRRLTLSNMDKTLYPDTGFTKAEVVDYYARVAEVLLPHVRGRPMTRKRYPDGVEGKAFFEKNAPGHTPDWVRTVRLPSPGSTKDRDEVEYVVVDDCATLVWLANLAALELHVPQWRVGPRGGVRGADLLVFDLDPGAPATVVECCRVAELIRTTLADDGLQAWPKTSGSKGLQLYVPVVETSWERTHAYARSVAERLEAEHRDVVVSRMTKSLRSGKVLIDWSQNNGAKTTVAPYSLRARALQTVSTPVSWAEVAECEAPDDLRFLASEVLDRLDQHGDLFAPLLDDDQRMPVPS